MRRGKSYQRQRRHLNQRRIQRVRSGPGPQPLTTAEFDEFVDSLCHDTQVDVDVEYDLETIELTWDKSPYYGPFTDPPYRGYSLTYRIERMDPDSGVQQEYRENWELVAEVTDEFSWTGDVAPGYWIYQVAIYSVSHARAIRQMLPTRLAWARSVRCPPAL